MDELSPAKRLLVYTVNAATVVIAILTLPVWIPIVIAMASIKYLNSS